MPNANTFISGASFTGPQRNSMEAVGHHVVESTPHPPTNGLAPFVYSQVIRLTTFPSQLMCVLLQLGPSSTEDTRNSLQKLIRVVQPPPIVTRGTAHPFTASTDQSICIGTTTGLQEATLTPRSSNKSRLDVQPGHLPSCHGQALQLASDQRATRVLSPGVGTPAAKIREEINANAGILMQMTMLQLVTIHHLVHRAPGDTRSQFDLIDDHLEAVRQKLHAELQVHTLLVLRQDQQLFPGDVMFTDVPTELVCLPSALDNDIELQQIHLELGSKPSNAAVDAYFEREVASLAL
ncbi:hypothetical protein MJO28_005082 [Puccinia striiformis f. sp. tritici]|uniref:Uncharacterized protein n=1 Tax=Puccinia striiformis f. sp. tritici TaxID=168172 RepID=A0ACC0ELE1_9BASI|nr:hypothetical protein MJO28_005082 [Puccinia striiformis f. sp. tritici]